MTDGPWLEWTHPKTGDVWRYRPDPVVPFQKPVAWGDGGCALLPSGMEIENAQPFTVVREAPSLEHLVEEQWKRVARGMHAHMNELMLRGPSTARWYPPAPPRPRLERLGRFVFVRIRTPFEILRDALVSWLGCGPSCGCD